MIVDSYKRIFSNKQRILVVTAHPDDLELYCGGLVSRLMSDGKMVRSVKMTSGDMGSRGQKISSVDLKNLREKEDMAAMEVLGVKPENNIYLRLPDGGIENTAYNIGLVAEQIRLFRPELIITHNSENQIVRWNAEESWVNHRDHRTTGQITIDAAYPYSRDLLFFPKHFENPAAASWSCTEYLIVDSYNHPDSIFIDVTEHVATRIEAHAKHSSQYSPSAAKDSADFFTKKWDPDGKLNFETFRYVIAD